MSPLVWRTTLWGAIGYGASFAFVHITLLPFLIETDTVTQWWLGTLFYAVAGGGGAAVLVYHSPYRSHTWQFIVAGAIGAGLGINMAKTLLYFIIWQFVPNDYLPIVSPLVYFPVIGGVMGFALGIVRANWNQIVRLALAGLIGFTLYYAWFAILSGIQTNWPILQSLGWFYVPLWGLVGGALIGVCIGSVFGPKSESPQSVIPAR